MWCGWREGSSRVTLTDLFIYLHALCSTSQNVVFLRLNPENSEKIYEVEDVVAALDGLQKATRSDFRGILITDHKCCIRSELDLRLRLQNHGGPPEGAEGSLREPGGGLEVKSGPSSKWEQQATNPVSREKQHQWDHSSRGVQAEQWELGVSKLGGCVWPTVIGQFFTVSFIWATGDTWAKDAGYRAAETKAGTRG